MQKSEYSGFFGCVLWPGVDNYQSDVPSFVTEKQIMASPLRNACRTMFDVSAHAETGMENILAHYTFKFLETDTQQSTCDFWFMVVGKGMHVFLH